VGDNGYLVLFLLAVVIVIAIWSRLRRGDTGAIAVDASSSEAVDAAVSYMVQQGFAISHRDDTSATFTRTTRPDTGLGCLLLLLGIVPGLLYLGCLREPGRPQSWPRRDRRARSS